MKITSLFSANRTFLSFEVFPPKQETAFESVLTAARSIAALRPAFVSVTYGAGGGTGDYTVAIAKSIEETGNVPSMAHLTCVSSGKESIRKQAKLIHETGIENILALRGDLTPEQQAADRSGWDYSHASELIRDLRTLPWEFCIGGACYPEIHPESANQSEDIAHLKEKVECGCDFLVTQMFFDNNLFYNFLYKIREAGITVPVLPGIMPITKANQVERAIRLSGAFMPQRFKSLVDRFGDDPAAMRQAGIAYATDQIIDLYANGIRGVHVYSMNKPEVAAGIWNNLSDIVGKECRR